MYPTCAQRSGFSRECDVVGGFRPVVTTKCQNAINNCAITVLQAVSNQCAITDYNCTSALENFLERFSRSVGIPSHNRSSAA